MMLRSPTSLSVLTTVASCSAPGVPPQGSTAPVAQAVPMDVAQGFVQAAFVDPSDPTKFYIPQGPR